MNKTFIFLIPALILSACTLDHDEIKELKWKYGEGFWIGDFPDFTFQKYKLRNDTIFVEDTAAAIIIKTNKEYFFDDSEITIKSIETGSIGTYYTKGKYKK